MSLQSVILLSATLFSSSGAIASRIGVSSEDALLRTFSWDADRAKALKTLKPSLAAGDRSPIVHTFKWDDAKAQARQTLGQSAVQAPHPAASTPAHSGTLPKGQVRVRTEINGVVTEELRPASRDIIGLDLTKSPPPPGASVSAKVKVDHVGVDETVVGLRINL